MFRAYDKTWHCYSTGKSDDQKYDSDVKFNGEIVSDLGTIHDFGEAMDGFGDIKNRIKLKLTKIGARKFLEAIVFTC